MMDDVSEDLFDYERPTGRIQILLHRIKWRWVVAGILVLSFVIPFLIAHFYPEANLGLPPIDDNTDPALWKAALSMTPSKAALKSERKPSSGSGSSRESLQKLEYKVAGNDPVSLMNMTNLDGLSTSCSAGNMLTSVSLSNVYLDAEEFSKSLLGCLSLEQISLENVWLSGNFSRVHLPNLSRFTYVQNGNDKRDSYKSPETLKQTLFFDKTEGSPWNVEKDLLNLGVEISIWKAGTRLLDIQRKKGEIYLNVKYCESVLVNVEGSYDSLTLINCNVTEASIPHIPATLKYINLRNAVQRTPTLAELTQKLTNLEELYIWLTFHCDWPGYELYLDLSSLPNTLKRLGLNNVDTTFAEFSLSPSFTNELTVGSYVTNKTIVEGLPLIFKNLDRINIVNVSDPTPAAGYSIINQAIKMRVKTIAVVHLHRNYSVSIESEEDMLEVETVLDNAGLPKSHLSCFILRLTAKGKYYARELSEQERHQIRYNGLGFDKMDSFEDYLKWDLLQ